VEIERRCHNAPSWQKRGGEDKRRERERNRQTGGERKKDRGKRKHVIFYMTA